MFPFKSKGVGKNGEESVGNSGRSPVSKDDFLSAVLSQVRFRPDRSEIKQELSDHLEDSAAYYLELSEEKAAGREDSPAPLSQEEALSAALRHMGDAVELGKKLNQEHNPFLGWIWWVSRGLAVILVCICAVTAVLPTALNLLVGLPELFFPASDKNLSASPIVYEIDHLNAKAQVDDQVIEILRLVYQEDGTMNVFYRSYRKNPFYYWTSSVGLSYADETGTRYPNGSGSTRSSTFYANGTDQVDHFPADASKLIISYEQYDRQFQMEIPLKDHPRRKAGESK